MSESPKPANDAEPHFENPADDPEIAALLGFEPVPRKISQVNGWTPEAQREFIARLAVIGSIGKTCDEMDKDRGGVAKLYRSPEGASFREAWHAAVDLAKARRARRVPSGPPVTGKPPTIDHRRKAAVPQAVECGDAPDEPGQMLNERGEWEDEGSLRRRAEDARDSISAKLLRARRLYLQEISPCAGKRAAFEILTDLPVDWERAGRLEPQIDEPWNPTNMRQPDMLLTAENGWIGEVARGPDKKAQLRRAIDEFRAARGLPPVNWDGDSAEV